MQSEELKEAISAFSIRFHKGINVNETDENYIAAPLGGWLLLAQLAGANSKVLSEVDASRIEDALGLPVPTAFNYANELINTAPPSIKTASAVWYNDNQLASEVTSEWVSNTLDAETVEVSGNIPTKTELDKWASDNTLGIINEFPFSPDAITLFILANTLATKISWNEPFEALTNNMKDAWTSEAVLVSPGHQHSKHFFKVDGEVFAVLVNSGDGIYVNAIIAENSELEPQYVLEIAERFTSGEVFEQIMPDELGLAGNIYTVNVHEGYSSRYTAYIPAWAAENKHDLGKVSLPLGSAIKAFTENRDITIDALQVAKVKFNRYGFEAAALTAMRVGAASVPSKQTVYDVDIFFNHPFAVVATHHSARRFRQEDESELWDRLPVFSAWVLAATEVDEEEIRPGF